MTIIEYQAPSYCPPASAHVARPGPHAGALEAALRNLYRDLENAVPVYRDYSSGTAEGYSQALQANIEEQLNAGILETIRTAIHHCGHPDVSPDMQGKLHAGLSRLRDMILASKPSACDGLCAVDAHDVEPIYSRALKAPLEYIAASLRLADIDEQACILRRLAEAMVVFPRVPRQAAVKPFLLNATAGAPLPSGLSRILAISPIVDALVPHLGIRDAEQQVRLDFTKIQALAQALSDRYGATEPVQGATPATAAVPALFPPDWRGISGDQICLVSDSDPGSLARFVHQRDAADKTLLMRMVEDNNLAAARVLLDCGAVPDEATWMAIVAPGRHDMLENVLQAGVDPNANLQGEDDPMVGRVTPFLCAVYKRNPQAVAALLRHGGDAMATLQVCLEYRWHTLRSVKISLLEDAVRMQSAREWIVARLQGAPADMPPLSRAFVSYSGWGNPPPREALLHIAEALDRAKVELSAEHEGLRSHAAYLNANWPEADADAPSAKNFEPEIEAITRMLARHVASLPAGGRADPLSPVSASA